MAVLKRTTSTYEGRFERDRFTWIEQDNHAQATELSAVHVHVAHLRNELGQYAIEDEAHADGAGGLTADFDS